MKRISTIMVFFLTLLISFPATAQISENVEQLSSMYNYWDEAKGLTLQGNYGFVATGQSGMVILDLSDWQNPRHISRWQHEGGSVESITVSGNYAYVFVERYGLSIVDISDLEIPIEIGRIFARGEITSVIPLDDFILITEAEFGLIIADLTEPNTPRVISGVEIPIYVYDVVRNGDLVYVAYSDVNRISHIGIVDISDYENPRMVTNIDVRCGDNLEIHRGHLYVGSWRLNIFDINEPARPRHVGEYEMPSYRMFFNGPYAFMCSGHLNTKIVDIRNPADIRVINNLEWDQVPVDMHFIERDQAVVLSEGHSNLRIWDIADLNQLRLVNEFSLRGSVIDVVVQGHLAFLACREDGLKIVDISDPYHPEEIGQFQTEMWAKCLAVQDSLVYIAPYYNGPGELVSVYDPQEPRLIRNLDFSPIVSMTKEQNFLYVAYHDGDEIGLIDISDPEHLDNDILIRTRGEPLSIAIKRDYAFVATGFWGVATINIPELEKVDNIDLPGDGVAVACEDNILYVVESEFMNSSGLRIFDVSNSFNPLNQGSLEFRHSLEDIYIEDNNAFLVGNAGLQVINVSDPESPEIVGHYRFPGWPTFEPGFMKSVHVENDIVYVADQSSFKIFRFDDPLKTEDQSVDIPQSFQLLQNYPNPFNSSTTLLYTLGKSGWVNANIYDPAGRLVENLVNGYQSQGQYSLPIYGDNLTTGTYLVRFETSEEKSTIGIQAIK